MNKDTREKALEQGFNGQKFNFDERERNCIAEIPHTTVSEFAQILNDCLSTPGRER
jgi:hypothetical protein